ncbi:uncharacterized protein RJT21DRAFT_111813 [Scheffersomyces amazonensis]|uniref:uncharacterized protein n=1 Tax=Scheffersomyces amazonensis TaxID=1078765 RepID=UPI00315C4D70
MSQVTTILSDSRRSPSLLQQLHEKNLRTRGNQSVLNEHEQEQEQHQEEEQELVCSNLTKYCQYAKSFGRTLLVRFKNVGYHLNKQMKSCHSISHSMTYNDEDSSMIGSTTTTTTTRSISCPVLQLQPSIINSNTEAIRVVTKKRSITLDPETILHNRKLRRQRVLEAVHDKKHIEYNNRKQQNKSSSVSSFLLSKIWCLDRHPSVPLFETYHLKPYKKP